MPVDRNADTPQRVRAALQKLIAEGTLHRHVDNEAPAGAIDGANATYTLVKTPRTGSLKLYKNGIRQQAGAGNDFTLASQTITFAAGNIPQAGDVLLADYVLSG
jgi:hypothetical protein